MAIPMILSGAAGRALRTLEPVAAMGGHVDNVFAGRVATNGTDLGSFLASSDDVLTRSAARSIINDAGSDIARALGGTRKPAFSAELHAATQNLRGSVDSLGRSGSIDDVTRAMNSGSEASSQIGAAMHELQTAASATARTRLVVGGSLAVGGALAGLIALSRGSGSDSIPMAPGPIGERGQPTGTSV